MNNKYHLGLAAFISVITCSAFIAGFFSGVYAVSDEQDKSKEAFNELRKVMMDISDINRESDFSSQYRLFEYNLRLLKNSDNFSNASIDMLKNNLRTQIPSLECQLAKFSDHHMREKALISINEAKGLIGEIHNKRLWRQDPQP